MRGSLVAVALCAALVACADRAELRADGRNVVLVVVDTLRADRLPFYGGNVGTAPFLASLAERGLVFENAWSASSWTAPAMASLFTSTYPNEHGVVTGLRAAARRSRRDAGHRLHRLPDAFETLPVFMKSRGYATFGVSANPNVAATLGFERGFDHFALVDYVGGRGAPDVVDALLGWRDELSASQPFFVLLHFMDPHEPYHRREPWVAAEPPGGGPAADLVAYDSEIRYVDEEIRRLFEELGLAENSLVMLTSDHGEEFGDHGGRGHSFQLYTELTRVPLLFFLSGEDGPRGRVAGHVSILDILPTLRELLGAPRSSQDAGVSLLGRDGPDGERAVFSMRTRQRAAGTARKRAVVRGSTRLIVSEPAGAVELYDLSADPGERLDVANERADEVRRLAELLESQAARSDPGVHAPFELPRMTTEERARLEALGYVGD